MPSTNDLFSPLRFYNLTMDLARYNQLRLEPGVAVDPHPEELAYIEAIREIVKPELPVFGDAKSTFAWYENLLRNGPGQNDALFHWLARKATLPQMKWFLGQEAAGEAGFGDLTAMTQVRMPLRAKLEMARNYWDEMGNGREVAVHDKLLRDLAIKLKIKHDIETTVPEALQLANILTALACHRRYAYLAVGALGGIEMTAPDRVGMVNKGLQRLGVSKKDRTYFALHATLDIKHSREWNREVIAPLTDHMAEVAEGAYLRLWAGAKCFDRYRLEFGLSPGASQ